MDLAVLAQDIPAEFENHYEKGCLLAIRVSTEVGETVTTIQIEGRLTGAELSDVRAACESANRPLRLDLSGLRSADVDGIRALRSLSETGAELVGASAYIRQLLLAVNK